MLNLIGITSKILLLSLLKHLVIKEFCYYRNPKFSLTIRYDIIEWLVNNMVYLHPVNLSPASVIVNYSA